MMGSALAHASLALVWQGRAIDPAPAIERWRHTHLGPSPFAVRIEDPLATRSPGPPMPAVAACFEREELLALDYRLAHGAGYGHLLELPSSWSDVEPDRRFEGVSEEIAGGLFRASLDECVGAARRSGWKGRGQVHVRVIRAPDGHARAQAWPLDDASSHPGLLCCVRESQALFVERVGAGQETRYVVHFGGDQTELRPNPLPRPLEAYEEIPCGGQACEF